MIPNNAGTSVRAASTARPTITGAAIVFGREDYGLGKDAIARCDVVSQIPLVAPYPSINLAQSVMIYCYTLSTAKLASTAAPADAGQYQARHRGNQRPPGEPHARAGGAGGTAGGVRHLETALQQHAVLGHEEEGVVDADAQT